LTLVAAPAVLWYARAIGLAWKAKLWIRPVFRFADAGAMARFGGAMILVQFFWFVQSQADVFIGGRLLDAHNLGIYTTALFLTQILAAKFVPPLNEVAYAAYARIQDQEALMTGAFLKTVRLIMLIALPFYLGLAVTAEPFVLTFLGPKWAEAARFVPILAAAMPLMTLQILFAPATNALGRASAAVRTGAVGAVVMAGGFAFGIQWGAIGLAWAWLGGMALVLAATIHLSLPEIGASRRGLAAAVAPGLGASLAMALAVAGLDSLLPELSPARRLAALVPFGAAVYVGMLFLFARSAIEEMLRLIRPAPAAA
jgi:O-antigen/teichoic acid export membrane protein